LYKTLAKYTQLVLQATKSSRFGRALLVNSDNELQGPAKYAPEVYCAILEAGKDFAIRRLGGRTAFINHLEAYFPTIVTDYLRAIFDDPMAEYLAEFKATMPDYAAKFNIAGSFEADDGSAWYRSR